MYSNCILFILASDDYKFDRSHWNSFYDLFRSHNTNPRFAALLLLEHFRRLQLSHSSTPRYHHPPKRTPKPPHDQTPPLSKSTQTLPSPRAHSTTPFHPPLPNLSKPSSQQPAASNTRPLHPSHPPPQPLAEGYLTRIVEWRGRGSPLAFY